MPVHTILPRELKRKLDDGEPLTLIDVRENHERARCAIGPHGVVDIHIPMADIPLRFAEVASRGGSIVVYCHHGVRSMVVARWLAGRSATDVFNLEGGIDAWSAQVDATVPRY